MPTYCEVREVVVGWPVRLGVLKGARAENSVGRPNRPVIKKVGRKKKLRTGRLIKSVQRSAQCKVQIVKVKLTVLFQMLLC